MINIKIQDIKYQVPASWNEITQKQLISLIKLSDKGMSYVEMQLKFFLICIQGSIRKKIGAGVFILKTKVGRHVLFSDELASILDVFDYLFDTNEDGNRSISPRLLINHFKKVRIGFRFLYGPNDQLDNITYDEFVWLQTWQSQLNDNPDALDEFINVIYKDRNDKRHLRAVHRFPRTVKTAILWFYVGTMQFLSDYFPHVFSGTSDENVNIFDNQQRIIDSLADGDVTKKNLVRNSLLFDALYSMEMAAIRIEQIEKQYNK